MGCKTNHWAHVTIILLLNFISFRPDLIDYEALDQRNPFDNLYNAFEVADIEFGIEKLLDPEDFNVEHPDEKSIITYIVSYYIYFTKFKHDNVQVILKQKSFLNYKTGSDLQTLGIQGKRISKAIGISMDFDQKIEEYESLVSNLLRWIQSKTEALLQQLPNSLSGLKVKLQEFNSYRKQEKPPKLIEKGNLEVMLFTLQSRMRSCNRNVFSPKEGKTISDVNKKWEILEKAEHELETRLREELLRQEKLEQLAKK